MTLDEAEVPVPVEPTVEQLTDVLRVVYALPTLVKETRLRLNLTQRDVADLSGVSQGLVTRVEQGDVNIRVTTLTRLLTWLAVAVTRPTPIRVPGRSPSSG